MFTLRNGLCITAKKINRDTNHISIIILFNVTIHWTEVIHIKYVTIVKYLYTYTSIKKMFASRYSFITT